MERQVATKAQKSAPRSNPHQFRSAGSSSPTHPLLHLQRSIGNQAFQRLIESSYIQTKLQVSTPEDPLEQEADRVAETVMRMTEAEATEENETPLQAKPLANEVSRLDQRAGEAQVEEKKELGEATEPLLQRSRVAVREDEEEEKIGLKLETDLSSPEDEKVRSVQEKGSSDALLQRKVREDEEIEEGVVAAPSIQRPVEEEEEIQRKPTAEQSTQLPGLFRGFDCAQSGVIHRLYTECAGGKKEKTAAITYRKATSWPRPDADEEDRQLQAQNQPAAPTITAPLAANIYAMNGGGRPLPETTRAFFEPRFGVDFSQVRVHTDSRAAESARSINARAFTVGSNIAFGSGQYAPESREGRHILAHELTHVLQQRGSHLQRTRPGATGQALQVANALGPKAEGNRGAENNFPSTGVSKLITPATPDMIHRQPQKGQQTRPTQIWPGETLFVSRPDVLLFGPVTALNKHWDFPKPTFTPLLGGTFIVDGIPVSYNLEGEAAAQSNALLVFGPGWLEQIRVIVTGAEAERMRRPRVFVVPPNPLVPLPVPIILPPPSEPHGSFSADAMLRFTANASADASAYARLNGSVGVFGNALSAGAFAGLGGSARGSVTTNVFTYVNFRWNDGAISIATAFDLEATLNLAFRLAAFAGVWVELRVPEIPVVTDLTHEVSSWPIVGWFVPDLSRWKWRKEYRKDWPLLDKSYTWDLEQRFVIGSSASSGSILNAEGFRLDNVLTDLQAKQKDGDLKDDPEGPGRERRNSDTGAVSAARASALAQIASAKRAADREKQANSRLLTGVKKAAAAARRASAGSPQTPSLAAVGPSAGDPVTDLEKREEKLDDAIDSTKELREKVDALDAPATAADGVTRNEARAGFEAVAKNADTLGDKVNNNEDVFALPAAAQPTNDSDYNAMRAALTKANDAFDNCFDVIRTEKLFADDQVDNAGSDVDLHSYRDAAVKYQGQTLKLWIRVQKLETDIEKAREWYEKGDYALGVQVFEELQVKAIELQDEGQTLRAVRPVGDWDADYVELSGGHLKLQPQFRGKATRSYFYPHDYSSDTKSRMLQEIGSFYTGEDGKIYWNYPRRKSPRGDFKWLLDDPSEQPTLDHLAPTVLAHWNTQGRTTTYPPRRAFYDFAGAKLTVVPQTLNSAAGGREPDSYTPLVTRSFRGAKT
jgi:hypothetical protein